MGASSVTGVGPGASNKLTGKDLAILANGPAILMSGKATLILDEEVASPPTYVYSVTFPEPLSGGFDAYNVMLTVEGGDVPAISANEDDDSNFTGFTLTSEEEVDVMYMVVRNGFRASV